MYNMNSKNMVMVWLNNSPNVKLHQWVSLMLQLFLQGTTEIKNEIFLLRKRPSNLISEKSSTMSQTVVRFAK